MSEIYKINRELCVPLRTLILSLMLLITSCDSSSGGGDKIVEPDPTDEDGRDTNPPG